MARKSRKNLPQPEQAAASVLLPELEEAKIPAAIYGRLSVEDEEKLVGVIATKDATHIALFFVDGKFQGQGIGRKLYNKIIELNNQEFFTVNSSPYAHEIYKHLGFVDTDTEQCINGLRFYPMKNSNL